jgi:GWxTD domain-containing protein
MPRRALWALAAAALALAACGSGGAPAPRSAGELVNFRLSPDLSHWLVGPIAAMATPEEVRGYLAIGDELSAVDFIESFWQRRDPDPEEPGNPVRIAFEQRAMDADRLYSEAGLLGRRTARGVVYVLHGEPARVEYEVAPDGGEPVEVWRYPEDAAPGLDGRPPNRLYWFRKQGGLTVPYQRGGRRSGVG